MPRKRFLATVAGILARFSTEFVRAQPSLHFPPALGFGGSFNPKCEVWVPGLLFSASDD